MGNAALNRRLKIILAIWALAYPVIACGPLLIADSALGNLVAGVIAAGAVALLLVPWVIGLVVLGFLVYVTRPERRY